MHLFISVENNRLALNLRDVEAILEKDRGIQLVTRSDTYMVKGEFLEVCGLVDKAQEGKA